MVEDHRHCIVCGKPVPPDKLVCSPACEEILRMQRKRYRRMQIYTMALFIVLFLVVLIVGVVRSAS